MKEVPLPFIPFQGLISPIFSLTFANQLYTGVIFVDLTFMEENPDKLSSGLINFSKMRMIAEVLLPIARIKVCMDSYSNVGVR